MQHLPEPFHRLRFSRRLHPATRPHARPASAGRAFQRGLHRGLSRLGLRGRRRLFRPSCVLLFHDPTQFRELIVRRARCAHSQGIAAHLPRAHSPRAHPPYSHGPNVSRLDLGARDSPLSGARCACRLHVQRLPSPARAVDVGFVHQRCHFGRRRPCLAAARRPRRVRADAVFRRSVCVVPRPSASFAVHAGSGPGARHRDAWFGRTSSAIAWALCGRAVERYVWGTRCFDVGTTVQTRDPWPLGCCDAAWIRSRERGHMSTLMSPSRAH